MQTPRTTHLVIIAAALAALAFGTWLYTNAHEPVEGLPNRVELRPDDAGVPQEPEGDTSGETGEAGETGETRPDASATASPDGLVLTPDGFKAQGAASESPEACKKAGGTWNECASACPPGTEICTMVCVQKCEGLPEEKPLVLHFMNSKLDPQQLDCAKTYPVRRAAKAAVEPRAALEALLKGPTKEEQASGSFSSIPAGVAVRSFAVRGGVASVDFNAALGKAAGSCLVTSIRAQVESTIKAASPSVTSVVISVEGGDPDEALQP